jgi:hypothetical protein
MSNPDDDPLLPLPADTHEEIGRLCAAWAYLEAATEATLWGILDLDQRFGPMITTKLDLHGRWGMIIEHAEKKHAGEMSALRKINKLLVDVARDRNIVVHGLIHAVSRPGLVTRPPSWTIFRGEGKGKCFPVSTKAARIIRENIQDIARMVDAFNARHKYTEACRPNDNLETGWPKRIG